ncbi:MAG: regulatory protein RecX [Solirubrobacterales bacterium]
MAPERDAFEAALGSIRRRERSTAEVVDWLAERDFGSEEIEDAVGRLIEIGELDDERFARLFAEDKRELSGWGPERIAGTLRERGIDRHLIEGACADERPEQVERAATLLWQRNSALEDDRDRARALSFLTRRGYDYEVAHDAIRTAERAAG